MLVYSASLGGGGVIVLAVLISFGIVIPKMRGQKAGSGDTDGAFQSCSVCDPAEGPFTFLISALSGTGAEADGR